MPNPLLVKQTLVRLINAMSETPQLFAVDPERNFRRRRKLPFEQVLVTILGMEGGSLAKELMLRFDCAPDMATAPAFVQQRAKLSANAFETLFHRFVNSFDNGPLYNGFRLLAVDGSDLLTPANKDDPDSYFPGVNGQRPYNLLHLNAMYDVMGNTYLDAIIQKRRLCDECRSLVSMVDRTKLNGPAIILADRGYESYNVLAHIQEKGWKFLIRAKDVNGIAGSLNLPNEDEFDLPLILTLTRKNTNQAKMQARSSAAFRIISGKTPFDYLPKKNRKAIDVPPYNLSLRVVRFRISDAACMTVITNLDADRFPPAEIKRLYNLRWGIETSFRNLKYTLGLLYFHAKKVEFICQEIFARLIIYNFTGLITASIVLCHGTKKYCYKVNFSAAVHICRQLLLGKVHPTDVEILLARFISPIRPGRSSPRKAASGTGFSFTYRVA